MSTTLIIRTFEDEYVDFEIDGEVISSFGFEEQGFNAMNDAKDLAVSLCEAFGIEYHEVDRDE
jgi:hypothetical protein